MTEIIKVRGKGKWIKHNAPNEWNKWTHVLYPDSQSLDKIRELQGQGIKNQVKKDDDGWYVTFSRPTTITNKGKVSPMSPPIVTDAMGKSLTGVSIGNGSDLTTTLEVYAHAVPGSDKKAKAARWQSTVVDTLIPYGSETESEVFGKLKEQAAPLF